MSEHNLSFPQQWNVVFSYYGLFTDDKVFSCRSALSISCQGINWFVGFAVVGERQFFLSLRYGRLIKKDLLFALLHGNLDFEDLQGPLGNEQVLEKNDSIHQPSAGVSKGEDSCVQQKVWHIFYILSNIWVMIYVTVFCNLIQ